LVANVLDKKEKKNFQGSVKNSLEEWIYFLKNSEIKEEFAAKGRVNASYVLTKIW